MKLRLRACRRCGGDLIPDDSDPYTRIFICLQCGSELVVGRRKRGLDSLLRMLPKAVQADLTNASSATARGRQW